MCLSLVAEPLSLLFYYVGLTNGERGRPRAARAWAWEENQIEVITGSRLTNAIKVKKEWWNGCVYYVSVWIRGEWRSWIVIRLWDGGGGEKKGFVGLIDVWGELPPRTPFPFRLGFVLLWCKNNDACYSVSLDRCRNIQQLPTGWEVNEKAQCGTFLKGLYRNDTCVFLVWVTTIGYLFTYDTLGMGWCPLWRFPYSTEQNRVQWNVAF